MTNWVVLRQNRIIIVVFAQTWEPIAAEDQRFAGYVRSGVLWNGILGKS